MISRRDHSGVVVLQLAHGKANALDVALLRELGAELDGLGAGTKALVLTGRDSIFSAGIDLPDLLARDTDYTLELVLVLNELLERFIDLSVPSIAAINGHAIAGGFILACGCDVRLMAEGKGQIGLTEHRVGVPFPPLALELVRQAVGERNAHRMVMQAELFPAATARELGMVDAVLPPDALLERSVDLGQRLGAVPRAAFELSKRQLMAPLRMRLATLGEAHYQAVERAWITTETREVMRGFVREHLG